MTLEVPEIVQHLGLGPLGQIICENNFLVDPMQFQAMCFI